jgi:hypothetical protein
MTIRTEVSAVLEVVSALEVIQEYRKLVRQKKIEILISAGYEKVQHSLDRAPIFIFVPPGCHLLPRGEENLYGRTLADGKGDACGLEITWCRYIAIIARTERVRLFACAGCASKLLPFADAPHRDGCLNSGRGR